MERHITGADLAALGTGSFHVPIDIGPEDAQLIESRKFQVLEVARIYSLPPHMVANSDRMRPRPDAPQGPDLPPSPPADQGR